VAVQAAAACSAFSVQNPLAASYSKPHTHAARCCATAHTHDMMTLVSWGLPAGLVLALSLHADAQLGIPSVCPYPVTYQMNRSTIIMPCNESGLTDPESTKGWGIVDFDVR
jgi:hypothetical protein